MQRYTPMNDDSSGPTAEPDKDPHGEWVRYTDAVAAIMAEREACAKAVEARCDWCGGHGYPPMPGGDELARLIRGRPPVA